MKDRRLTTFSRFRAGLTAVAVGLLACGASLAPMAAMATPASASSPPPTSCPAGSTLETLTGASQAQCIITSTGTPVGAVKHVWLIILENKSYDETFTGLNQNTYLWTTLPQQGALLTQYYGTGHFSMDNYISMVSGQAPSYAVQDDCATTANMTNNNSGIITAGTVGTVTDTDLTADGGGHFTTAPTTSGGSNGNYGQLLVHGGVDAALTGNGCVYPTDVPTLFNQFNAAGVSWKGYAQDLGGAQPTGATTYVTGSIPGVSDTVPGRDDGACGYPGTTSNDPVTNPTVLSPAPSSGDVTSFTGAQPANANGNGDPADQFVAKHFPFGWFAALSGESAGTQSSVTYPAQPALNEPTTPEYDGPGAPTTGSTDTNCDANHIANLDDPTYGLEHDLSLPANEVPAFSWITPNNCSDAHDATCQGNNLSGAFNPDGTPDYTPAGLPQYDPEATTPLNYTGGLYAADLFLRYYIPLIEQSAAFNAGGLIDVTYDEANPPFTVGNSFNNEPVPSTSGSEATSGPIINGDSSSFSAPADQPTYGTPGSTAPGANSLFGAYGLEADLAGENINGVNYPTEPTGPNDPEVTDSSGDQLQPGPGASGFIDRLTGLTGESPYLSGSPGTATEPAVVAAGSSIVNDPKINADDTGRLISGTDSSGDVIPPDTFVGAVSNTGPVLLSSNASTTTAANNYGKPWTGTFQLLNDSGQPVTLTNGYNGNVTLSAEGATSTLGTTACPTASESATNSKCVTVDPLFDATDFTPGGGDTGSVLISPYITPGTVSATYYNHYSWLRTMEDLFLTGATCAEPSNADTPLVAGTVCGGLDSLGHIGYAAQDGLASFGADVFTNPNGPTTPPPNVPESPLAIFLPAAALFIGGGGYYRSRRHSRRGATII
ncbi:MAG: phosphoesterase [Acidimicrobiales bacterium]